MNKYIIVDIRLYNLNRFLLDAIQKGITIERISYSKNILRCRIKENDLNKISKYYKIKIVKSINKETIFLFIKNNLLLMSSILFGMVLFFFFSSLIIQVDILSTNEELKKNLLKSLDNLEIRRLTFKKSKNKINAIKKRIEDEYKNEIEWLEIKENGMTYEVLLEERKLALPNKEENYCHVTAQRDGLVTKIIARKGNVVVHENSYVREGDTLISGDITFNDEIKSTVCARGTVYGEVWYSVKLTIPKKYEQKNYTGKSKYNLILDSGRNDYKIFRSRFKNYESERKTLISLLGKKIILEKEKEYTYKELFYTEEELTKKIDEIIIEKINLSLEKKERILYKNILKKEEFDSTIDIEIFVTVEKILGSNE